jgi:methylmalonyl-CoA mutase cobalamin-binding domain/chain
MHPIRILTAVPICDGHDSAINTINLEMIHNGIEVVYLGYNRTSNSIVRAAIQEDVAAIGISTYNGGHIEFFEEVIQALRRLSLDPAIRIFGGGGGTITREDAEVMNQYGVDRIFFAGTPLAETVTYVKGLRSTLVSGSYDASFTGTDQFLARQLTIAEANTAGSLSGFERTEAPKNIDCAAKVIGFTGPGGAGKTTLIDELVHRFLQSRPKTQRIAVLSHDPSAVGSGALLGDRATMIYSQDDRVFMRSLATRGASGGLSPATNACLELIVQCGLFDYVLVETIGTGQEAIPFHSPLVDTIVLIMPPDYGSRLQLQKIAMMDVADVIVVNKSDLQGSRTAAAEIESRIRRNPNRGAQTMIRAQANRHRDPGVNQLFNLLFEPAMQTLQS